MNVLTSRQDALNRLLALLQRVEPRLVPMREAAGCMAAQDVVAQAPVPAHAVALRDGYALRADDIAGASSYAPVLLAQKPAFVNAGSCVPDGCDCVVDSSGLDLDGPLPQAIVESFPGENLRRAGEDMARGAVMIRAGQKFSALACAACEAAGVLDVAVRRPVVSVQGEAGAAKDMLVSWLAAEGVRPGERPDLLLHVGALRGDVLAHPLALEPGRDLAIATQGGVPAIILPPRPDLALAAFVAFILPALDHLCGAARTLACLPLAQKIASRVGVTEVVALREEAGRFIVLACGDLPLQSLLSATHVALVDAGSEGHAAGEMISAFPVRA